MKTYSGWQIITGLIVIPIGGILIVIAVKTIIEYFSPKETEPDTIESINGCAVIFLGMISLLGVFLIILFSFGGPEGILGFFFTPAKIGGAIVIYILIRIFMQAQRK